jgi:hypothetical protein
MAMAQPLAEMVRQIPQLSNRDLQELPLLTFGAQLQGSNNTQIGKAAMKEVFNSRKADCPNAHRGDQRQGVDDTELNRKNGLG